MIALEQRQIELVYHSSSAVETLEHFVHDYFGSDMGGHQAQRRNEHNAPEQFHRRPKNTCSQRPRADANCV